MRPIDELKSDVIAEVETHKAELIAIADAIHANPEIAFEEYDAAELLSSTLEESAFTVERGVGGLDTAFVATLEGAKDRPRVAFLAEYDALPELGHACGHNLIATAALGAGLAMRAVISELEGAVQVIGTPAEERGGGKVILVDAGVFDGVDAAMMVHPSNYNMTRRTSLTSHKVIVEFFGKPAHAAAAPDEGINALDALIQTFNGVNALRQHLRDDARIHGIITHGGKATNIVPGYAAAQFGIRAADVGYAQRVIAKVRACAEAGALATGARLKFTQPDYSYANMMPNPVLADLTDANMASLGIEVRLPSPKERMGSSDMGNVSQVVPALHSYISIGSEDIVGHTAEFREAAASPEGHDGMIKAAQFLAMTAIDLLAAPANLCEAHKVFRQQKGGTDLV
jgi:amidohydrolase